MPREEPEGSVYSVYIVCRASQAVPAAAYNMCDKVILSCHLYSYDRFSREKKYPKA